MDIHAMKVEWEEDGCYVLLSTDDGTIRARVHDPEQAYDAIRGGIFPWLYEKEQAFNQFRQNVREGAFRCDPDESGGYSETVFTDAGAYTLDHPKHPTFHDRNADRQQETDR